MKIQDYTFQINEFSIHHLDDLLPEDSLLFDIETTGFKADYQTIYLIGIGFRKKSTITIRLLYARTKEEEIEILEEFEQTCFNYNRLISFNGDMFDLPFITKRCKKLGISCSFLNLSSLDLFKVAKKYKSYLNLEHYKQKDLENYFGIFREDQYNGGHLIELYKKQTLMPDASEEELLFLHNMEDVKGMIYLLQLMDFSIIKNHNYSLTSFEFHRDEIHLTLLLPAPSNLCLKVMRENAFIYLKNDTLTVTLSCFVGKLKYFYPDYKNYVYVADENLLLPKSLASTIAKDRIQKATKQQCFIEKEGVFLRDTMNLDERHFKAEYEDKTSYVEINPTTLSENFLVAYVRSLL
ncbi:MAG: ribonuclease H-like domain-containing protein [Lachnospiraceae bacterium]|nr:ribonuclease H-like domain-containing protein [Lachnospiraceae bacterium]